MCINKTGTRYGESSTNVHSFPCSKQSKSMVINNLTASAAKSKYSEQCVRMTHQPDAVRGAARKNISHLFPRLPHWECLRRRRVSAALLWPPCALLQLSRGSLSPSSGKNYHYTTFLNLYRCCAPFEAKCVH